MAKETKRKVAVEDEPGAEDRFMRGITKALETPPKPYTPKAKKKAGKGKKNAR